MSKENIRWSDGRWRPGRRDFTDRSLPMIGAFDEEDRLRLRGRQGVLVGDTVDFNRARRSGRMRNEAGVLTAVYRKPIRLGALTPLLTRLFGTLTVEVNDIARPVSMFNRPTRIHTPEGREFREEQERATVWRYGSGSVGRIG